jgi:cellulose synthase/poly-beta-1,6-N-acetylglucosamine synthase-like glycosyltransferase
MLVEPEPGPGLARNRGVTGALGGILAFIDADCRAHPDWLKNALGAMKRCEENMILGGDVQIWRTMTNKYTALEAYECIYAYRFKLYIERHGFSGTGNLVVRRPDFDRVGLFAGISVAEDIDWGRRALASGFRFHYVPEMIVYHPARRTLKELFVKWDRHLQHAANLNNGTFTWKVRWLARAMAVLASPLVEIQTVLFSARVDGFTARVKASFVMTLVRFYRAWRMVALLSSNREVVWNPGEGAASSAPRRTVSKEVAAARIDI